MLQLNVEDYDRVRINQMFMRYKIKAKLGLGKIFIKKDISEELLSKIIMELDVQNIVYYSNFEQLNEAIQDETYKERLFYQNIKRGEIYWCNFGEIYGHEQSGYRYAIVIQNNIGNKYSPTTIVVPCTTKLKKILPTHLKCEFSVKNMKDYNSYLVDDLKNIALFEQIRVIDKRRLSDYVGTLKEDYMEVFENYINISLGLN